MAEPDWLSDEQLGAWLPVAALVLLLPQHLETATQRHGLSLFEYTMLVALSTQDDRTLRVSDLASIGFASLSRTSHVIRRLEDQGIVSRHASPEDGRVTLVTLTDDGGKRLATAAPDHLRSVREVIFDNLDAEQAKQFGELSRRVVKRIDPHGTHWIDGAT